MPRFSLQLFGRLNLTLDGAPYTAFRSDKARALLAYLAVETDRPHRRETLAGLLWPDYSEASARQSLSQALVSLNRASHATAPDPPLLTLNHAEVQFNSAACSTDVGTFQGLILQASRHGHAPGELCPDCAALLEQALGAYRGDLLAGLGVRDSPEFDDWLLVARERLRRQAVYAASALARWGELTGDHEPAAANARRWAELDPMDEEAHRTLMRLLARGGHRSTALTQFEACRRMLRSELGVEPEEETRALFERIRTGDPALAPPKEQSENTLRTPVDSAVQPGRARHNLPAAVDSFVGRERELAEVQSLLRNPAVRLVTLVGAGGMGKTRLALEVGRGASPGLADEAWLVDLAPLPPAAQASGSAAVVESVARTLAVEPRPGQTLLEGLATALRDRRVLLLMDNCEHVLDDAALLIERLLAGCPALRVLATSRQPLRVAGEHAYELAPLSIPGGPYGAEPVSVEDALGCAAVRMFAERAAAARFGLTVEGPDAGFALSICRRLDGLPLAIELAAARLSALTLAELAGALERAGASDGLLGVELRGASPRQRTLQNTIRWSYDLLDDAGRRLYARLSVFPGSFTAQAAEAVCGEGMPTGSPPLLLVSLVEASLVQRAEGSMGVQRYRLLEPLRAFGRERLAEMGEAERIAELHATYYLEMTREMEPALRGVSLEIIGLMNALDDERHNLSAAIVWCLAHDRPSMAVGIASAVEYWAMHRAYLEEYAGYMRRALVSVDRLDALDQARAWEIIALYAFNWGDAEEEDRAVRAELDAAFAAGDLYWQGWATMRQAYAARHDSPMECRQVLLRRCLELARHTGDLLLLYTAEGGLAMLEESGERLEHLERLLEADLGGVESYTRMRAANTAWGLARLERAEEHMRRSSDGWGTLGNRTVQGSLLCDMAGIRLLRGAGATEVLALYERGMALIKRAGFKRTYTERVAGQGQMLLRLGRRPEAVTVLKDAVALAGEWGHADLQREGMLALALALAECGALDEARAARSAALQLPGTLIQGDQLDTLGQVALLCGEVDEAIAALREQRAYTRQLEWRAGAIPATEHLAWALAEAGELEEATALLSEAHREREAVGMVLYPVEVPHHDRALALVGGRAQKGGVVRWRDA